MNLQDDQFQLEFETYLKKNFSNLNIKESRFNIFRVDIQVNSVWKFNSILVKKIFSFPEKFLSLAEKSLNKVMCFFSNSNKKFTNKLEFYKINLIGPFGFDYNSIIKLSSNNIGELVCVKGIVIFCGEIKISKNHSVFFCKKNSKFYIRNENKVSTEENFEFLENPKVSGMQIEHGLSNYFEQQKIIISEDPLKEKKGLSQYLVVYIYKDLVSNFNIGDEVEICGIFKPSKIGKLTDNFGIFAVNLSANSIKKLRYRKNLISNKLDFLLINYFSMFPDCFERLSSLIVPQIPGINLIKKSFLLSLMNLNIGKKRNSFFGENINLLLIGDYDLIKDELFSSISKIFSIFWVNNYEKFLIVPESQGKKRRKILDSVKSNDKMFFFSKSEFAYLDNLENLSYRDKNILGEVLERCDINENINIENNTNNPFPTIIGWVRVKDKKCDLNKSIRKNIDFSDSFFNQFDLPLFLPDKISPSREKEEVKLILHNHCFLKKNDLFSEIAQDYFEENNRKKSYEKSCKKEKQSRNTFEFNYPSISQNFLGNYILYARSEVHCFLSKNVVDFLIDKYCILRLKIENSEQNEIRIFETIVKLCFAFTKCHLRNLVSVYDAEYILDFLSLLHNVKSQIKFNACEDFTKNKIKSEEKKTTKTHIINKKRTGKKYQNSGYSLNKIRVQEIEKKNWDKFSTHISSFFIKNNISKFALNSLKERAISIWNYRNLCINIGNDLIRI